MLSFFHLYEFILCGGRNCSHQGTTAFRLQPHPHVVHLCLFTLPRSKSQGLRRWQTASDFWKCICLTSDIWMAEGAAWKKKRMPKCAATEKQWFHNFGMPTENIFRYDVEKWTCLVKTEISQQVLDDFLRHFVQMFMVPRGLILLILEIPLFYFVLPVVLL